MNRTQAVGMSWKAAVVSVAALAAVAGLAGCNGGGGQTVTRVDPNTVIDLEYRWTGDDAREVYRAMSTDALYRRWVDNWMGDNQGRRPIVIVGPVRNDTQDYIDTAQFTTDFERELLNSERVRFVAMRDQRGAVRDERLQGQDWNTPETRKQVRAELGADLMLLGRITDNLQRALDNRTLVKEYLVNLELVNIETNEKVWIGSHAIKKLVNRR